MKLEKYFLPRESILVLLLGLKVQRLPGKGVGWGQLIRGS